MFITSLFIITQMPINRWIHKMQHIYITEYYSAMKWNKVLTYVTTWVNLENILLGEKSRDNRIQLILNI